MISKLSRIAGLISLVILSACIARPTTLPTQTVAPSPSNRPSDTPLPRQTPTQPPTVTPTPTPTPTLTSTVTLTPTPEFAGFQVYGVELKPFGMLFTFKVPNINQVYKLDVNGLPYTCSIDKKYPDRTFCYGPQFPNGQNVHLTFYLTDKSQPAFQTTYRVALYAKIVTEEPVNCPMRGLNVGCETENRIADNGPCVVASCFDSCGYWYSIDTCVYSTPFVGAKQQTQTVEAYNQTLRARTP